MGNLLLSACASAPAESTIINDMHVNGTLSYVSIQYHAQDLTQEAIRSDVSSIIMLP